MIPKPAAFKSLKPFGAASGEGMQSGFMSSERSTLYFSRKTWDIHEGQLVTDAAYWNTPEGQQAAEKTNIAVDRFQETFKRIDREISVLEEKRRAHPFDQEIAIRLHNLYKLRNLTNVLRSKIVSLPSARRLK